MGGSNAILFFGGGQSMTPLGNGCFLYPTGLLPFSLVVPLSGTLPGEGNRSIATTLPSTIGGSSITMQAFVIDPVNVIGAAASNGLDVTFLP